MDFEFRYHSLATIALAILLFLTLGHSIVADPVVVSVGDSNYNSIQAAVDTAKPGSTVLVKKGTYQENIVIDKNLVLRGTVSDQVVIKGKKQGRPILLVGPSAVKVTIKNLSVRAARGGNCNNWEKGICPFGISVIGKARVEVIRAKIEENGTGGLRLADSATGTIQNCQISNNAAGIELWYSATVTITDSRITNNTLVGIALGSLGSGSAVVLENNTISENIVGLSILKPQNFDGIIKGNGNQIEGNQINFKGVGSSLRRRLLAGGK